LTWEGDFARELFDDLRETDLLTTDGLGDGLGGGVFFTMDDEGEPDSEEYEGEFDSGVPEYEDELVIGTAFDTVLVAAGVEVDVAGVDVVVLEVGAEDVGVVGGLVDGDGGGTEGKGEVGLSRGLLGVETESLDPATHCGLLFGAAVALDTVDDAGRVVGSVLGVAADWAEVTLDTVDDAGLVVGSVVDVGWDLIVDCGVVDTFGAEVDFDGGGDVGLVVGVELVAGDLDGDWVEVGWALIVDCGEFGAVVDLDGGGDVGLVVTFGEEVDLEGGGEVGLVVVACGDTDAFGVDVDLEGGGEVGLVCCVVLAGTDCDWGEEAVCCCTFEGWVLEGGAFGPLDADGSGGLDCAAGVAEPLCALIPGIAAIQLF
jgi:hypothetical protein